MGTVRRVSEFCVARLLGAPVDDDKLLNTRGPATHKGRLHMTIGMQTGMQTGLQTGVSSVYTG